MGSYKEINGLNVQYSTVARSVETFSRAYTLGIQETIRNCNEILEQIDLSHINSFFDSIDYKDTMKVLAENLSGIDKAVEAGRKAYQAIQVNEDEILRSISAMQDSIKILQEYWNQLYDAFRQIDIGALKWNAELSTFNSSYYEMLDNLQRAMKLCLSDIDIPDYSKLELTDELLEIVSDIGSGKISDEEIKKKDISWKVRIVHVIGEIIFAIFISYLSYIMEPVFQILNPVRLWADKDNTSDIIAEIPQGCEVTIWSNDFSQDYIEVSYLDGDVYRQGYVEKDDIKENAIQISEEHQIEEILFSNSCVELMAKFWGIEQEAAYNRICVETNLLKDYLIPNYQVLSTIAEDDLVKEIDEHYNEFATQEDEIAHCVDQTE